MSLVFRAQYCTMPVLGVKRKFHYRTKKYAKTMFDDAGDWVRDAGEVVLQQIMYEQPDAGSSGAASRETSPSIGCLDT